MLHRLMVCLAAVCCLVVAQNAVAQHSVRLVPQFKPGQDLIYPLALRITTSQTIVNKEVREWTLLCNGTLVMRIDTINEDGTIKASGRFKRGNLRLETKDGTVGYSWGADAQYDPAWGDVAAMAGPLEQARLTIEVDTQRQVTVSGLDAALTQFLEVGGGDDRILGFFTPEKLGEILTPIFDLDQTPTEPMTGGREWQTTKITPIPDAGELKLTYDMMLQRVEAHEAEYFGMPRGELIPPEEPRNMTVTLSNTAGGIEGLFDFNSRMLVRRKDNLKLQTVWRSEEAQIVQTQSIISYLQLGEQKR